MFDIFLFILGFILGGLTIILFSCIKISSNHSRQEEELQRKKEWFNKNFNHGKDFEDDNK